MQVTLSMHIPNKGQKYTGLFHVVAFASICVTTKYVGPWWTQCKQCTLGVPMLHFLPFMQSSLCKCLIILGLTIFCHHPLTGFKSSRIAICRVVAFDNDPSYNISKKVVGVSNIKLSSNIWSTFTWLMDFTLHLFSQATKQALIHRQPSCGKCHVNCRLLLKYTQ